MSLEKKGASDQYRIHIEYLLDSKLVKDENQAKSLYKILVRTAQEVENDRSISKQGKINRVSFFSSGR